MLSDHAKVTSVVLAYRKVAIEVKRASSFLFVKAPPENSKTYSNCVQFYDSAEEFGVSVPALMMICVDSYSPWWCMKVFKRNYPSFTLAISEKTRNRALLNFPKTVVNNKQDELAQFYADQLQVYDWDISSGLVLNGMCGDDKIIQGLVLNKLKKERAT